MLKKNSVQYYGAVRFNIVARSRVLCPRTLIKTHHEPSIRSTHTLTITMDTLEVAKIECM